MRIVTKAAVMGIGLFAGVGVAATAHAQYYNYYGTLYNDYWSPNIYAWSPYITQDGSPDFQEHPITIIIRVRGISMTIPLTTTTRDNLSPRQRPIGTRTSA
jgi:hypothetical protein